MGTPTFVILIVCFATFAVADDFKTINGKEYKDATVSRVEPDGITIKFSGGIVKVPFTELPKEVQQRFNYNPEKAAEYSANQNAALEQARKQQEQATQSPTQLSVQEDDKIKAIMNSTQTQRAEIGEEQNGADKEQRPLQAWIRQTIHRSKDDCCRCRKGFCRRGVSAAP